MLTFLRFLMMSINLLSVRVDICVSCESDIFFPCNLPMSKGRIECDFLMNFECF